MPVKYICFLNVMTLLYVLTKKCLLLLKKQIGGSYFQMSTKKSIKDRELNFVVLDRSVNRRVGKIKTRPNNQK